MSYISKYVGRWFSSWYHGMGINSATLTGAIDVIIVEQSDGSFTCSPFHVRFGKLGVLRSREKVVDIEINGSPVNLHMKLGETGEAFFVQEMGPEAQVPDYLSTSPLFSSDQLMRDGVNELRRNSGIGSVSKPHPPSASNNEPHSNYSEPPSNYDEPPFRTIRETPHSKSKRRRKRSTPRIERPAVMETDIFEMDVSTDEEEVERTFAQSTPKAIVTGPPTDEECRMKRTQSWAESQFESGPQAFSDSEALLDLGCNYRPASPLSDSEVECYKNRTITETSSDEQTLWEWGDLPKTQMKSSSYLNGLEVLKEPIPTNKAKNAVKKKNNKMRPPEEGLYLADLMNDSIDPEVAKLYFPKSSYQFQSIRECDEDAESGKGMSLPQSPHSVDGSIGGPTVTYLRSEVESLGPVSMSLCGGLSEDVTLDHFMQKIVTYDELAKTPSLINSSDLVIKIDDKFYNWQTASPILISQIVFQKNLPIETISNLIKDFMPKKRNRGSSWFPWRRSTVAVQSQSSSDGQSSQNIQNLVSDATVGVEQEKSPSENLIKENGIVVSAPSSLSSSPKKCPQISARSGSGEEEIALSDVDTESSDKGYSVHISSDGKVYQKTLRLSNEQIKSLGLHAGQNTVVYSVTTQYQGTTRCVSHIYLWHWTDKIVISDIDGTITKSDVLGQILPIVGRDWSQSGVANLYTKIHRNGYKFVYLSARAIGQSSITKDLLKSIKQGNVLLPEGPILLSPTSLIRAFHLEVIEKKPEGFKINCLSDVAELFPPNSHPFYAGFGNKINDVYAYKALNIPQSHIFTINYSGQLKREKFLTFQSTYHEMCDTVDCFFPPLSGDHEDLSDDSWSRDYSAVSYWREPFVHIELDDVVAPLDKLAPA